jgi:predicted DNA-binding protein (MmcQ/YjbR family)
MPDYAKIEKELRAAALKYPGTYEETPWGDRVTKVKGKIFVFVSAGHEKGKLSFTTKLPISGSMALQFPFAKPTGYGLGKSGWVSASFKDDEDVPVGLLLEWLDESYRAIAPKTLVKQLDGGAAAPSKETPRKPKKPTAKPAGTVLLVGDDPLRLDRAKKALGGKATVASPDDDLVAKVTTKPPRAVIVDLGRRPDLALEVGAALARLDRAPVLFAGARDAATVKKVKKLGCVARKEPPGDEAVLEELAKLSVAKKR